jgi:hypothetical protein
MAIWDESRPDAGAGARLTLSVSVAEYDVADGRPV